jgi:hypothetical protein
MALHFGQGVALVYYPPSPTLPSQETFRISKRKLSEGRRASTRTNKKNQPNPNSCSPIMTCVVSFLSFAKFDPPYLVRRATR